MRTNWILTTTVLAMSVTAAIGAQSAKAMGKPSKGDMMNTTYTGCVESVNHGGAFLLTRVDGVGAGFMHDDKAMKHHDEPAMKGDTAKTMQHEQTPMADDGQKVSVTGSLSDGSMGTMRQDVSTLTVKTLKVIAKSCS